MGYIFESEIESIIHAVRIKTIGEDDDIHLKKILSSNIHPAIKAYFKAEVEKILHQERSTELRSKKLPYSLPEVRSLEQQIDLLLVQNYHFSSQEFESLLDESVHFQFNYLCRPQWTLLNFIIGEQRRVASSVIERRLRYCVDYTYFPELIKRFMVDHGLTEVTYEEFKSLIEKIDREVVARHSTIELAHMTRALFAFVESGKMVPQTEFEQQLLPINAAVVFFEDKLLMDIRVRLEFERDRNRVVQITADQLADLIEKVRTGDEEASAYPVHKQAEIPLVIQRAADPSIEEASGKAPDETPDAIEIQDEPEDSPKPPVLVFGENDEQYLSSTPSMKQKELLDLFQGEELHQVVKKLFANDEPSFRAAITEISLMHSWDHAAVFLDTLYLANNVDPFGTEAVLFTDTLFEHFHSPDSKK